MKEGCPKSKGQPALDATQQVQRRGRGMVRVTIRCQVQDAQAGQRRVQVPRGIEDANRAHLPAAARQQSTNPVAAVFIQIQ